MFKPSYSATDKPSRMRAWTKEIRVNPGVRGYPYLVMKFYANGAKGVKFNIFHNTLLQAEFTEVVGNLPGIFEWMNALFLIAQVGDFDATCAFLGNLTLTINGVAYEVKKSAKR